MPKLLDKFVERMELWAVRKAEVGRFDGIGLVDLRGHPPSFRQTIESALQLVRAHDPRRYARITKHIRWIANRVTNSMGAEFEGSIGVCNFEFSDFLGPDPDVTAARYACLLVHEATHGAIESYGIVMRPHNCIRLERLCVTEQNRFAARLTAADSERYPRDSLHLDFRAGYWHREWSDSPMKRRLSFLRRWLVDWW